MQSFAQKNWKKRRRGLSNKITVKDKEGKRVPRIRQVVSVRETDVR